MLIPADGRFTTHSSHSRFVEEAVTGPFRFAPLS